MIDWKMIGVRSAKTFLQALVAVYPTGTFWLGAETLDAAVAAVVAAAGAAAFSAAMNLLSEVEKVEHGEALDG